MAFSREICRSSCITLSARFRIETRRRLVGQNHLRIIGQGASDRHALLLAARELVRIHFGTLRDFEIVEQFPCPFRCPLTADIDPAQRFGPLSGRTSTRPCCVSRRPDAVPYAVTAAYWSTASTSFANPAVTIARSLSDPLTGIAPAGVVAFILSRLLGMLAAVIVSRWFWCERMTAR